MRVGIACYCVAMVALVGNMPAVAYSQEASRDLSIVIDTQKPTYIELEPVRITVKVANLTAHPVKMRECLGDVDSIQMMISRDGREYERYSARKDSYFTVTSDHMIPPSAEAQWHETVYRYRMGEDRRRELYAPGTFFCKCVVRYVTGEGLAEEVHEVVSNAVEVKVDAASGVDLEAARYLKENDLDEHLLVGADVGAVGDAHLGKMVKYIAMFPGSSYERYVLAGLGDMYAARVRAGKHSGEVPCALEYYSKALVDQAHPFYEDICFVAGSISEEVGNYEVADGYFRCVMDRGVKYTKAVGELVRRRKKKE